MDLDVWKISIQLVTEIYRITENYPKIEIYGLSNQVRRSAVSIPSNIAEGAARSSSKEFLQFLSIALGSIAELETQIIISKNLKFIEDNQFNQLSNELNAIRKMTYGMKRSISNKY